MLIVGHHLQLRDYGPCMIIFMNVRVFNRCHFMVTICFCILLHCKCGLCCVAKSSAFIDIVKIQAYFNHHVILTSIAYIIAR
jgi:hypothetical protein